MTLATHAAAACGVALALAAASVPAAAQDKSGAGLTGDWGGARTRLEQEGWTLDVEDRFEAGDLLSGGRRLAVGANEMRFGATADLGKLWGLKGGTAKVVVTDRSGGSLGPSTGLDPLMPFIEIHGRGDIWRLTDLWYAQDLPGGFNLKLGRMDPGEDFDSFSCDFENLTFCGAPPGNLVGDYWYNWPVSEWGSRLKWKRGDLYAETGAYHVDPRDLSDGFNLSFGGGKGTLVPFEVGWTPKLGASALPGTWLLGGWWTSVDAPDVLWAADGAPIPLTSAPARTHGRQWGEYASIQQQVSGTAGGKGFSVFANYMHADQATSRLDRQFAVGVSYEGPIPGRGKDVVALAFGGTHVNSRAAQAAALAAPAQPVPRTEHVTELDYRLRAWPGVTVTPNLQYVDDPGGLRARHATVLGLKTIIKF